MARKPQGRRKIEIEQLPNGGSRDVALSRRRTGLFKKALELCIICRCQLAIVMYAMANKLFAIGHTSAASTAAVFLNGTPDINQPGQEHQDDQLAEATEKMSQLDISIANEEKKGRAMNEILKEDKDDSGKYWWLRPRDQLTIDDIVEMMEKAKQLEQLVSAEKSASSEIQPTGNIVAGNIVSAPLVDQDGVGCTSGSPERITEKAKGKAPMQD